MSKRQSITVEVHYQEEYSHAKVGTDIPFMGKLSELLTHLKRVRASIPAEYRDEAVFEITSIGGLDNGHEAALSVSYERPETDEELAGRLASRDVWLGKRRAKAMEELRRLETELGLEPRVVFQTHPEPIRRR